MCRNYQSFEESSYGVNNSEKDSNQQSLPYKIYRLQAVKFHDTLNTDIRDGNCHRQA